MPLPPADPLPKRYAPANSSANSTLNPFFNLDMPLVRSAQGYVSGGTIGFRTGEPSTPFGHRDYTCQS